MLRICMLFLVYLCTASAFSKPIIGYGSSDAVLPTKNQELFYMGFELALKAKLGNDTTNKILTVHQTADGSAAGAIRSAKILLDRGVRMLVGFPTSHEAVLTANKFDDKNMLMIFSGAGHASLAKFGSNVFTTGEAMDYSVASTIDFISEMYPGKTGLVTINPKALFSVNQGQVIQEIAAKSDTKVKLNLVNLDNDLGLNQPQLEQLKAGNIQFIYVTQYADESSRLLEQMMKLGIDIPIIASTSWTTGDVELLRRLLVYRKSPTYSGTLWIKGSPESHEFENLVTKSFGREPTAEMAYGYDLGQIVGAVVTRSKGNLSKKGLLDTFLGNPCFDKLTVGTICFPKDGGHALRKIFPVRFTKAGYERVSSRGKL